MGGINRPHAASILKHHSNPGFPGKYSVYSSLNSFRLFIILHLVLYCLGLFMSTRLPSPFLPLLDHSTSFLWPCGPITLYSYDTVILSPFSSLLYSTLLAPVVCAKGAYSCGGACARAEVGEPPVLLFPPRHAILPCGVERRVCCGGERGPMWSVGLDARCTCVFLLSRLRPFVSLRWGSSFG